MGDLKIILFIIPALILLPSAHADRSCSTAQGKKCVCASDRVNKCATFAKAKCISGETVESPREELRSAHYNYLDLYRRCKEKGGLKEVVFNDPIYNSATVQAASDGD